jgi:hypothetical protein
VQVPALVPGDPREPHGEVLAGRQPDQLVAEVAVGQRVLGAGGARLVDRPGVREQVDQRRAVVEVDVPRRLGERRQPGLVREHVPDRGPTLAVRGVRRPQLGHPLVEAERALDDRGQDGQRRERLGARVGHGQGVGGPRPVAVEGPGHRLLEDRTVAHQARRGARVVEAVEERLEGPAHRTILS